MQLISTLVESEVIAVCFELSGTLQHLEECELSLKHIILCLESVNGLHIYGTQ